MRKVLFFLFPCFKQSSVEKNFKKLMRYSKHLKRHEEREEKKDIRTWVKSAQDYFVEETKGCTKLKQ